MHSVTLASAKEHLLTDKRFLKELLEKMPEKIDLQVAAKIYIEGISRIHAAARSLVERTLDGSRSLIEDAIGSYRKVSSGNTIGLHAVQFQGDTIVDHPTCVRRKQDSRRMTCAVPEHSSRCTAKTQAMSIESRAERTHR